MFCFSHILRPDEWVIFCFENKNMICLKKDQTKLLRRTSSSYESRDIDCQYCLHYCAFLMGQMVSTLFAYILKMGCIDFSQNTRPNQTPLKKNVGVKLKHSLLSLIFASITNQWLMNMKK